MNITSKHPNLTRNSHTLHLDQKPLWIPGRSVRLSHLHAGSVKNCTCPHCGTTWTPTVFGFLVQILREVGASALLLSRRDIFWTVMGSPSNTACNHSCSVLRCFPLPVPARSTDCTHSCSVLRCFTLPVPARSTDCTHSCSVLRCFTLPVPARSRVPMQATAFT